MSGVAGLAIHPSGARSGPLLTHDTNPHRVAIDRRRGRRCWLGLVPGISSNAVIEVELEARERWGGERLYLKRWRRDRAERPRHNAIYADGLETSRNVHAIPARQNSRATQARQTNFRRSSGHSLPRAARNQPCP